MEKEKPFKNKHYYVAYAYHHWANENDIINIPIKKYKQAYKRAQSLLCDDDDVAIYYRENDQWTKVC